MKHGRLSSLIESAALRIVPFVFGTALKPRANCPIHYTFAPDEA
jgi:hypothetical protein